MENKVLLELKLEDQVVFTLSTSGDANQIRNGTYEFTKEMSDNGDIHVQKLTKQRTRVPIKGVTSLIDNNNSKLSKFNRRKVIIMNDKMRIRQIPLETNDNIGIGDDRMVKDIGNNAKVPDGTNAPGRMRRYTKENHVFKVKAPSSLTGSIMKDRSHSHSVIFNSFIEDQDTSQKRVKVRWCVAG